MMPCLPCIGLRSIPAHVQQAGRHAARVSCTCVLGVCDKALLSHACMRQPAGSCGGPAGATHQQLSQAPRAWRQLSAACKLR